MSIYYIIFVFIALASLTVPQKLQLKVAGFLTVIITFFVGLRWEVGNDYLVYLLNYQSIKNGTGQSVSTEPLYQLINYLSPNFEVVIMFFAAFSFLFLFKTFKFFTERNA